MKTRNPIAPAPMNTTTRNPAVAAPDTRAEALTASTHLTKATTMNTQSPIVSPLSLATSTPYEAVLPNRAEAWELTRALRTSIPKEKLCALNFDLRNAVIAMISAYRRVLPFRAQILEMPRFEPRCVDHMLTYCAAMQFGDKRLEECVNKKLTPTQLNADAVKHWDRLMTRLTPAAEDGFFPQSVIDTVRPGTGWKDRADDLSALATSGMQYLPRLAGNTSLTLEDFTKAQALSDLLYVHLGLKAEPVDLSQAELERHQAITLAFDSYEQVRRAMLWIRFAEKDAHKFAPSVHRNEFMTRTASSEDTSDEEGSEEDTTEDREAEPADPSAKPEEAKVSLKPVDPKKAAAPKQPGSSIFAPARPEDDIVKYGPNGLPLVPQDDPFAKD